MAGIIQLGGGCQSGRAGSHYSYFFTRTNMGDLRLYITVIKGNFNNMFFNFFNGYGWRINA